MSKQVRIANGFLQPFFSSFMHTGNNTMAISKPKNNGIKSVFPKYSRKPAAKTMGIRLNERISLLTTSDFYPIKLTR